MNYSFFESFFQLPPQRLQADLRLVAQQDLQLLAVDRRRSAGLGAEELLHLKKSAGSRALKVRNPDAVEG